MAGASFTDYLHAHALRCWVAKGTLGGEAKTFADDRRVRHLLAARVANAAHDPHDPDGAGRNSGVEALSGARSVASLR